MPDRVSFDRVADIYDETRGLPPTPLAKAVGVLAEELQGKRVLEIGVGTGRYAVPLQKSGVRVIGVDIAPKMVARGLEKGLRDVVFADGARLPFRDESFDAATSNHVLHLVPDWRSVLAEVRRVLRKEGRYFSLLERHPEASLSERYRDIVRALGYTKTNPGLHERDFPQLVPPARVVRVAHHEDRVPAERALEPIEKRQYAFLWKIPDETHNEVMRVLHGEFDGTVLDRSFDLEIAFWTRDGVAALAAVAHA